MRIFFIYPAPRTRTNICEATAGRGWPGLAPRDPRQGLTETQWTSLLATIFVLLYFPACLPVSGPYEREGLFAPPCNAGIVDPPWHFLQRSERSKPKLLGWFKE